YSPTGNYFFQNLLPGSYAIGQEVPAVFLRLRPDSGEQNITFIPGGFTGATNFAMQRAGSISGKLFIDTNGNGVLNVGETGIPGQSIFLDQDNNLALAPPTITTHSNGVDLPIPDGGKTASAITLSGIDPLQLITGVGVALSITH